MVDFYVNVNMSRIIDFLWSNENNSSQQFNSTLQERSDVVTEESPSNSSRGQENNLTTPTDTARRLFHNSTIISTNRVDSHSPYDPLYFSSISRYVDEEDDVNVLMTQAEERVDDMDVPEINFDYLNTVNPCTPSGWKDLNDKVYIETNSTNKDLKKLLFAECITLQTKLRRICKLESNQDPSLKQIFDLYFGKDSPIAQPIIFATGMTHTNFLKFVCTTCILIMFKMSHRSFYSIRGILNPDLMVRDSGISLYL